MIRCQFFLFPRATSQAGMLACTFYSQICKSESMDIVIFAATLPVAEESALIFVANK